VGPELGAGGGVAGTLSQTGCVLTTVVCCLLIVQLA
jgi:hypothetical protein